MDGQTAVPLVRLTLMGELDADGNGRATHTNLHYHPDLDLTEADLVKLVTDWTGLIAAKTAAGDYLSAFGIEMPK